MPDTNYDDAATALLDNVFAPHFFQKLANDYGVAPEDENEAVRLLQLADKLRYEDQVEQAKVASAQRSLLDLAHQHVDKKLGTQSHNPSIKAAAAQYASSPLIRDAALLYQDAIAQNLVG